MARYLQELFDLSGRRAVVIGGTGVLCGRMALALASAGAEVVVSGGNAEKGRARVEEIRRVGGKAFFLPVDVADRGSIERLGEESAARVGPIDVLINGAGVNSATPYDQIGEVEWDRIFAINLRGVHAACQVFTPGMIERQRGSVINIGSVSAGPPLSRVFAYAASKAAVVNYTQNLARELGETGVRVNCLSPGFFPAEQNRAILSEERIASILRHTPMNRFGEPAELDGALLLLASDAGRFITGANLLVDGGFTAMTI